MTLRIAFPAALAAMLAAAALLMPSAALADTSNCKVVKTLPYTMSVPGHYCLASNFTYAGTGAYALRIAASRVSLDCNGYGIEQTVDGATDGLYAAGMSEIVVRNCTFVNFQRGVRILGGAPRASEIELVGNTVVGARVTGMQLELRNSLVRGNRIVDTAGGIGLQVTGDNDGLVTVDDNLVRGVVGAATAYGIVVGGNGRVVIDGNRVSGIGTASTPAAASVRVVSSSSVTPSPAIITDNIFFAPTAAVNVAVNRAATTALSRCANNIVRGTPGGTQFAANKGCL